MYLPLLTVKLTIFAKTVQTDVLKLDLIIISALVLIIIFFFSNIVRICTNKCLQIYSFVRNCENVYDH